MKFSLHIRHIQQTMRRATQEEIRSDVSLTFSLASRKETMEPLQILAALACVDNRFVEDQLSHRPDEEELRKDIQLAPNVRPVRQSIARSRSS